MTSIKKMGVRDVMCNLIMIISYQSIVACIHVVTEGQLQYVYIIEIYSGFESRLDIQLKIYCFLFQSVSHSKFFM